VAVRLQRWRAGISEGVAAEDAHAPVTGVVVTERGPFLHRVAQPDIAGSFGGLAEATLAAGAVLAVCGLTPSGSFDPHPGSGCL